MISIPYLAGFLPQTAYGLGGALLLSWRARLTCSHPSQSNTSVSLCQHSPFGSLLTLNLFQRRANTQPFQNTAFTSCLSKVWSLSWVRRFPEIRSFQLTTFRVTEMLSDCLKCLLVIPHYVFLWANCYRERVVAVWALLLLSIVVKFPGIFLFLFPGCRVVAVADDD